MGDEAFKRLKKRGPLQQKPKGQMIERKYELLEESRETQRRKKVPAGGGSVLGVGKKEGRQGWEMQGTKLEGTTHLLPGRGKVENARKGKTWEKTATQPEFHRDLLENSMKKKGVVVKGPPEKASSGRA